MFGVCVGNSLGSLADIHWLFWVQNALGSLCRILYDSHNDYNDPLQVCHMEMYICKIMSCLISIQKFDWEGSYNVWFYLVKLNLIKSSLDKYTNLMGKFFYHKHNNDAI